jgi:hypothetical protein
MRRAKLIRYCDDLVILRRGNPYPWMERLERVITSLKLSLNAEKARVVDVATGVDFLGARFLLKPMRSNPKRQFCYSGQMLTLRRIAVQLCGRRCVKGQPSKR